MWVIMERVGGLGNQLFQYAAACAVARHHPQSVIVVGPEENNPHNHCRHDYAKLFMKRALVVDKNDMEEEFLMEKKFLQETSFSPWNPQSLSLPVRMIGYFQYYPAVKYVLPTLLNEWRASLRPFCKQHVCEQDTLFMHVRRGDYLLSPSYFHIQSHHYYENAFRLWKHSTQRETVQVHLITNDAEWCRQQKWSFPTTIVDETDEIKVLAFMSQCKAGAVIANSTFSYWGALLSGTEHVFYPEKWVAETIYHLCPSNWTCVGGEKSE